MWRVTAVAAFCWAVTASFWPRTELLGAQSPASVCRERAERLRNAAVRCRSRLASGELDRCTVRVTFRMDSRISIGEAGALASNFERRAGEFTRAERVAKEYEEAESKVREYTNQVERDQRAVQNLGFSKRAEEFEEWAALSEEAKRAFERETLDALLTTTLLTAQDRMKALASLDPPKANRWITWLKSKGADDPFLFDAIRALARARGKPQYAKRVNEFLDRVAQAKDTYSVAKDISQAPPGDPNVVLEALGTVLSWAIEDPKLAFLVAESRWATASLYNNLTRRVSKAQVENLTRLTEEQLKILKSLTETLQEDVRKLNAAKREFGRLPAPGPAPPPCN